MSNEIPGVIKYMLVGVMSFLYLIGLWALSLESDYALEQEAKTTIARHLEWVPTMAIRDMTIFIGFSALLMVAIVFVMWRESLRTRVLSLMLAGGGAVALALFVLPIIFP